MTKITSAKDVLLRSLEVLEEEVFRFHCFDADYLLQPGVGQIGTYQLERAEEGIKIGRDSTEAKLEEIKKYLHSHRYYYRLMYKMGGL